MHNNFTSSDIKYMKEALKLAKRGIGWTNPHPMVGAVIVKNGKIIAVGYHKKFGSDHAEMEALKHASRNVKGAEMYVTLEPCHLPYDLYGPRIPCVEIIKKAGIKKAHIAMLDSNPEVAGRGKEALEKVGIKTTFGLMNTEAVHLNETYHHFMRTGRPFVAITFSASLDGKIATKTGDSQWITNREARLFSRKLRGKYQAILVGINTVLADDPHLGVRLKGEKDPLRIILDSTLRIPLQAQVLRDNNVLVVTTNKADKDKKLRLGKKGVTILTFKQKTIPIEELLQELSKRKIISILVEGGGKTLGSFVDEKLVDKIYAFIAPIIIGGEKAIGAVGGNGVEKISEVMRLQDITLQKFNNNFLIIGYTNN